MQGKGEMERIVQLNAEFQEQGEIGKALLNSGKKQEKDDRG